MRTWCVVVAVAFALAGCANAGPGRPQSTRYLEQNAKASADFQPPGSLPPSF